jgi:hypothetical protein
LPPCCPATASGDGERPHRRGQGTHASLVAANGLYARLARLQFDSVSLSSMRRFWLRASSLSPCVERLELAEAGGDQPVGRHAVCAIRNFTTEVARAEDSSQLSAVAAGARQRHVVGMAVDAQHPVDLRRDSPLRAR